MKITIQEAQTLLRAGGVVAIPTDTVYGLAGDMASRIAVRNIYELKGRPDSNPLPVLVADVSQVRPFLSKVPPGFEKLVKAFWPGALTLVLPVDPSKVLSEVRAGKDSVGFRVPAHPLTLELLRRFGPVVATSANRSGEPPACSAEDVEGIFGASFPVVDGGRSPLAQASTVVAYGKGGWVVTRQGALQEDQINSALVGSY